MLQKPDVHTERLLELADFIEKLAPERFSMSQWGMNEEPRCICGWYQHLHGHIYKDDWRNAAADLGIDHGTANKLFCQKSMTTKQAAKTLRHLAVTGELVLA